MTPAPILGAVLAGGRSRRLGRDKAAEPVGDVPLITRAVQALSGACDEVIVISSRPETPSGAWRRVPDMRPDAGPLGGIETALEQARLAGYASVFVLACDLPLVDERVVRKVADALGTAVAAAPIRDGDPPFEPLCAIYSASTLASAGTLLDSGERAARSLLDVVGGVRVETGPEVSMNVNTEEDLARAVEVLAPPDPTC